MFKLMGNRIYILPILCVLRLDEKFIESKSAQAEECALGKAYILQWTYIAMMMMMIFYLESSSLAAIYNAKFLLIYELCFLDACFVSCLDL